MIWLFLGGVLGLALIFCVFWTWNFSYWQRRGIPGPKPSLFFGNTKSLVADKVSVAYEFDKFYREFYGKTPFIGVYILRSPHILAIDPDFVKFVLVENFKQFYNNYISDMCTAKSEPYIGHSPFVMKDRDWKDTRSQWAPAFTSGKMKAIFPIIENTCQKMSTFLKSEVAKQSEDGVHFRDVSARFTTEVVTDTIFGIEAGTFTQEDAPLCDLGAKLLDCFENVVNFFILTAVLPLLKRFQCFWIVSRNVGQSFEELMKKGIQFRSQSNTQRSDFLSFIMDLGSKKNLSLTEMTSHGLTVYLDGYETTSIAIPLVLYELGRNERAQEKLRKEIREYEAKGGINYESIQEMPYLDQVVNETMRIHPPLIIISKLCTENVKYSVNGKAVEIPRGMTVHIPIFSIHRNEHNFPNPEEFIPERFDEENGGSKVFKDKCSFLPFGNGPRICLGMRFAMLQVKTSVVEVIRQYCVTVNEKTQQPLKLDVGQFFSYPRHGIYLNLKAV
ncbi:probable cytochrome P450 28a5 [Phlebotomus argentipes]|uniref:probable cytochrome P450 28a5 n=1 Tax=Phlebotomus argentipes TaxID=94469 RepID=UPI0028936EC1|nr:probable cytochrome P450 28a5 [Phlebotomus argentipes]